MTPLPPLKWTKPTDPRIDEVVQEYAQEAAKAERKAALLWAAELVRNYSFFGGLPMFRAHVVAALRDEAEKME